MIVLGNARILSKKPHVQIVPLLAPENFANCPVYLCFVPLFTQRGPGTWRGHNKEWADGPRVPRTVSGDSRGWKLCLSCPEAVNIPWKHHRIDILCYPINLERCADLLIESNQQSHPLSHHIILCVVTRIVNKNKGSVWETQAWIDIRNVTLGASFRYSELALVKMSRTVAFGRDILNAPDVDIED